jgi:hypothetical protein
VHADRCQRVTDLIELEGFDDRDDEFHGSPSIFPEFPAGRARTMLFSF